MVITTLEGKLQRIDNLDKAVEHLMRRVETLDNRVIDNIHKTDSVISKLRVLDNLAYDTTDSVPFVKTTKTNNLDNRLVQLDQKVSDIDTKLEVLKSQIDNNFLPADDFNVEASEKKPVSMNVVEITRAMNAEVINHVTKELGQLKSTTEGIDKKLQFHINIASESFGKILKQISDIHEALVESQDYHGWNHTTTTSAPQIRSSKIDSLVQQIKPIMSVSEKMDEVWEVVVGTKSSVDDLVPKSDELLTHTQRQERAIGEIHQDLRAKANLIIDNLNIVEKRLKKQEDDVANYAQRPVPAELLMDPTIDRLVEYDSNRFSIIEDFTEPLPTTFPSSTSVPLPIAAGSSGSTMNPTAPQNSTGTIPTIVAAAAAAAAAGTTKPLSRKGGIIFPSVKNKPSVVNTTFTADALSFKDVKV